MKTTKLNKFEINLRAESENGELDNPFKNVLSEWHYHEPISDVSCLCGKKELVHAHVMINKLNGNMINVGSSCVLKFMTEILTDIQIDNIKTYMDDMKKIMKGSYIIYTPHENPYQVQGIDRKQYTDEQLDNNIFIWDLHFKVKYGLNLLEKYPEKTKSKFIQDIILLLNVNKDTKKHKLNIGLSKFDHQFLVSIAYQYMVKKELTPKQISFYEKITKNKLEIITKRFDDILKSKYYYDTHDNRIEMMNKMDNGLFHLGWVREHRGLTNMTDEEILIRINEIYKESKKQKINL